MIDRDFLVNFIETHRIKIVIILGSFLAVLLLVLLLGLAIEGSKKSRQEQRQEEAKKLSFSPDELWLPDEPFSVPEIQYSRISPSFWSAEDEKAWYNAPDSETLNELNTIARQQIDDLLESVP